MVKEKNVGNGLPLNKMRKVTITIVTTHGNTYVTDFETTDKSDGYQDTRYHWDDEGEKVTSVDFTLHLENVVLGGS
jgi:hypothetical protein